MISALAGSHILHINSASVPAMPSELNRPTSAVPNKSMRRSQMVLPFPELGTQEGGREPEPAASQISSGSRFLQCGV